jgi:hypothetical protein
MTDDAPLPRPAAARLHAGGTHTQARILFGLTEWSADEAAPALIVPLAPTESVAEVAAQLPDPASVAEATLVVAVAGTPAQRGLLGRIFTREAPISRQARATALLARGYVRIGAAVDDGTGLDLVWGYAPVP